MSRKHARRKVNLEEARRVRAVIPTPERRLRGIRMLGTPRTRPGFGGASIVALASHDFRRSFGGGREMIPLMILIGICALTYLTLTGMFYWYGKHP